MAFISSIIGSIFGSKKEIRTLFLGLDASGRTTTLYMLKLGERISTIPTIGFNVESVELSGSTIQAWDIGGCDKIRPLWRHYFHETEAVVFFVDSADTERMTDSSNPKSLNTAAGLLRSTMDEDELSNIVLLVLANKQDLPGALSAEEIAVLLDLSSYHTSSRSVICSGCSMADLESVRQPMRQLISLVNERRNQLQREATGISMVAPSTSSGVEAISDMEAILNEWLQRIDEPDDEFLLKLDDCSLESWDHRTHLRIAWLFLNRNGRREGMKKVFSSIKKFIEMSPRTRGRTGRGTTFNETMTYFWTHMVHYAMVSTNNPTNTFPTFLLLNPQLANGGLFLHYYSRHRMLLDPESRSSVLLPDVRPLPSLLSDVNIHDVGGKALEDRLQPRDALTDSEFLTAVRSVGLSGWGHDSRIRLIYLVIQERRPGNFELVGRNTDAVLRSLADVEKEYFHLTEAYFWLHMVTYNIAIMNRDIQSGRYLAPNTAPIGVNPGISISSDGIATNKQSPIQSESKERIELGLPIPTFDEFYRRPHCQTLRNSQLIDKFYSRAVIDSSSAKTEFCLPDLKKLPSSVPKC